MGRLFWLASSIRLDGVGGAAFLQGVQVGGLIIGGARFPARVDDANPLVGQGAYGGVVFVLPTICWEETFPCLGNHFKL